ncbi:MAG: hypothetical protein ACI4RU_07185 [Acutalibacteraceae bacterium]
MVFEKVGSEYELFYRYDADGKLSFISRKRFSDNNVSSFSVVTNSQGDVIRILSGSGSVSAEYKYDAWGNPTSYRGHNLSWTNNSSIIFDSPLPLEYGIVHFHYQSHTFHLGVVTPILFHGLAPPFTDKPVNLSAFHMEHTK